MSVSVILGRGSLNKASDPTQNKILQKEVSEPERIKVIVLLCLGGFLISWAAFEAFGRICSEGYTNSYNSFQEFCYTNPNPFVCPLYAGTTAVDFIGESAYEKVGSFWLAVGCYLVPAVITTRKVLQGPSTEKIKNDDIFSNHLNKQNSGTPQLLQKATTRDCAIQNILK